MNKRTTINFFINNPITKLIKNILYDLNMDTIILASGSPRRIEYLKLLGLPFISIPPNIDESIEIGAEPEAAVKDLANCKAEKIAMDLRTGKVTAEPNKPIWIIAADTIISLNGKIYGKAGTREEAASMLKSFSGKIHEVITAIALNKLDNNYNTETFDCRTVRSKVSFDSIKEAEIEFYLNSGEWEDAAGAYKIQGLASCFINHIEGSYSSIVGLPLREFYVMLRDNKYPFRVS